MPLLISAFHSISLRATYLVLVQTNGVPSNFARAPLEGCTTADVDPVM